MIKQLVVGIDGSDYALTAAKYAEHFAKSTDSELKFVFVMDSRKTELPSIYAAGHFDYAFTRAYIPPDNRLRGFYQKVKKDIASFADHCMATCRQRCQEQRIPVSCIQREGLPSKILSEEARSGDILVIGQKGENARFARTIVGSTTEDIVRSSPRPILVCPRDFRSPEKLLFPYDGSITAERALQFIVNAFDSFWKELVILLAGSGPAVDTGLEKELRYLKKHDMSYRTVTEAGSPVDSVLRVAEREQSGLIVVGAHGAHKIRDYILGSTTSHLVRKSHLPVLIVY